MEFISEIVDALRGTVAEVRSLGEIPCTPHHTALATCSTADFNRFGVYTEIFLAAVHGIGNAFANLLTQVTRRLTAVIELAAGYEVGNHITAVIQLVFKQPVLTVDTFSLSGKRQSHHLKVRELGNDTTTWHISLFIHKISRKMLAYLENFNELCVQVAHSLIV